MGLEISSFPQNGAALVEGLISREEAFALGATVESYLDANPELPKHAFRDAARKISGIAALARKSQVVQLAKHLLSASPQLVQAIFFDKTPESNWKVAWHQDLAVPAEAKVEAKGFGPWSTKEGIPYVQPPAEVLERMVILRIHLDDCGDDNGPLRIVPGSHLHGRLRDDEVTGMTKEDAVCILSAGGAVAMKPLLLHASSPAKSPGHRRVIHLEYAAGDLGQGLKWFRALD